MSMAAVMGGIVVTSGLLVLTSSIHGRKRVRRARRLIHS
jgi:hypothetical protein